MAENLETGTATAENIENITIASEEDAMLDNSPPLLPWGKFKEKVDFPQNICINPSTKPGEFVLQILFGEFTVLAQKKIDEVLKGNDPQKPLSKFLQRGEDPNFDQLLSSLSDVAENSLPSILRTLFEWYDRQIPEDLNKTKSKTKGEKYYAAERRDLAVDFICCLVLIEVLKQLPYHPGHDDLCNRIITQAFKHFRFKEGAQSSPNAANINITSDLYAEVIGVLATSRFTNVKKRFMYEMKELRSKDQSPYAVDSIISLLMGMRFFRVKMHPIEEFQASIQFLSDLGQHFLDPKEHIKIKHALAGLFVEILLPVAAVVKTEVNVPVLKNFVETLYQPTLDIANKKKHSMSLFPMVTCLLCVSQKTFFLNNWPNFLRLCLEHLKDKDNAMARIALESLYRLIWVYMIRIKCESNSVTQSRLESIVTSLFPRGSRDVVMPKDTPLNIFVKIIQFIAQEKTDYAMREIIFDLLYAGKRKGELTPERMCIGLRAFLVIADSRQQKEGEPPMPQTMGVMPSGSTLRFKKTFINKYLSEETAKHIGMHAYYPHVRKAFGNILRVLDTYVGRPRLFTKLENVKSEMQKEIPGEEKKKIDLFRTCVAAIPRLLPEGMSRNDLIELLSRLTIHYDDELGKLAFQSLQNIISDLPEWRNYVLKGFVSFIQKEVNDTFPQYLELCNRKLIQLLIQYKTATQTALQGGSNPGTLTKQDKNTEKQHQEREKKENREKKKDKEKKKEDENATSKKKGESLTSVMTMHEMEGFALVMLCSCKPMVRKHAVIILKEVRNIYSVLDRPMDAEPCVLDVMDKCCPVVIERVMPHLPGPERAAALSACHLDFQWLADRTSIIWHSAGYQEMNENNNANAPSGKFDPWVECISIFMHPEYVMGHCPSTVAHTWPMLFARLKTSYEYLDPATMYERTSILGRPGARKLPNERDMYMNLWQNYVVMVCCIAPPYQVSEPQRCVSPDLNTSSPDSAASEVKTPTYQETARDLFKLLVPLIRTEGSDMRETVVVGLGHINPVAFSDLTEELLPIIREAIDRKVENVRKKRKRDTLRQALVRIFRIMAEGGVFSQSPAGVLDERTNALSSTFIEYIEGARLFLESEPDKQPLIQEVKLNFSGFIRHLIRNMPVEKRKNFLSHDLRLKLFHLFATWSGKFGRTFVATDKRFIHSVRCDNISELELSSLQAMAAVLSCGSVFAPKELNDNGYVYPWLDTLLGAHDDKVKVQIYRLAQETIVLLLEYNPDMATMLEWVIDRCYTGTHEVADGCFNALATVFNNSEYPCDHVAMLNVTLLNISSPRAAIHETAIQLFQLLYKRFFLDEVLITDQEPNQERDQEGGDGGDGLAQSVEQDRKFKHRQETLLSGPYSRSQFYLSETLARLHPKLTMPMFSEITQRFQTAIPSVRQVMLQYLLPWLFNIELVDQNIPIPGNDMASFELKLQEAQCGDYRKPPLKGEGWGTPQATDMVLNNLFYITAKFSDDHAKEMEDLWAALVDCWPGNLKVIIRYLIIVTSMGPTYLLEHAKRVTTYLGRAKPDNLVKELVNELHTVEALNFNVERTQTPPFYRLSNKKQSLASNHDEENDVLGDRLTLDKGQIHTKRHSAEDPNKLTVDVCQRTDSAASLRSETSMSSVATVTSVASGLSACTIKTGPESELEDLASTSTRATSDIKRCDSPGPVPYPLPMPAYGGYFAPMSKLMPEGDLPNPPYQRCNLAVMLLTDLVMDGVDIDWTIHLPLMLHIIFLGLDHNRALIHEHCKKLLLNLLLVLSAHNDKFGVARIILGNKGINDDTALTLPKNVSAKDFHYTENIESSGDTDTTISTINVNSTTSLTPDSVSSLEDVDTLTSTEDVAKALIEFIVTRKCRPLWSYEDITAKVHNIKSAEQLEHFLKYVLRIFKESVPEALLEQRWAKVALELALSCSSRHYAGRSFQIFRAMKVPLNSKMLGDILSRLVETVAEEGEDMKGYVTEIMLTLECAVDNLDVDFRSIDFVRELFMSTPNLTKEPKMEMKKSATVAVRQSPSHHHRSTSYSFASMSRRGLTSSPLGLDTRVTNRKEITSLPPTLGVIDLPRPQPNIPPTLLEEIVETRHQRPGAGGDETRSKTNLSRSRSAQSLKQLQDPTGVDDKLTILSQLFWIAVSLLESDYEYEFLLAARLLDKILGHIQPDRHEYREKLDKILHQISWPNFPGVQAMLLKGCTHPTTAECTFHLLTKLTHCITAPVIDPSGGIGFPMNVIATLPFLIEHYEDPDNYCIDAADNIYKVCLDKSPKLDNLATVMNLYSRGTFGKDSMQWTKCVVKYLYDEYSDVSVSIIAFLVEVLDKGPATIQGPILQILHCIVNHIDLTPSASQSAIISDLMRMVARFVESPCWKEALKILKLCVTRSSSLSTPPPGGVSASAANVKMLTDLNISAHTSFAEAEVLIKKELPGRTLDFTFDLSNTPIIGGKYPSEVPSPASVDSDSGMDSIKGIEDGNAEGICMEGIDKKEMAGWKCPQGSQARTRERLVNLLTSYGPGRVDLPKSPSVIFDGDFPVTNTPDKVGSIDSAGSESSSTHEAVAPDDSSAEQAINAFDFLDNELDESEDGGSCIFNQGISRQKLLKADDNNRERSASSNREESSDEEGEGGVTPKDDYNKELQGLSTIQSANEITLLDTGSKLANSPISGSSHSLHSAGSDIDTTDLSPSHSNASPCTPFGSFHGDDKLEDMWKRHFHQVVADKKGDTVGSTFQIFNRLFQDQQEQLQLLTRDILEVLAKSDVVKPYTEKLSQQLDILMVDMSCPVAFVDGEMLKASNLVTKLTCSLLEINTSYETFDGMKRDQAAEHLEMLKCGEKEHPQDGDSSMEDCTEEQKIDLCRWLYKLHFQLLQLYENYCKLLVILVKADRPTAVTDLTHNIQEMREDLTKALNEAECKGAEAEPQASITPYPMPPGSSREDVIKLLMESLQGRNFEKAIQVIKAFRALIPQDNAVYLSIDDIECILYIFCKQQTEILSGVYAVTKTHSELVEKIANLQDRKVELSSATMELEQAVRCEGDLMLRMSESSTL